MTMSALYPGSVDHAAPPAVSDHGIILRQVAGLTAGGSVPMNEGRYGLGLSSEAARSLRIGTAAQTQFSVEIAHNGGIYVDPQRAMVRSGGRALSGHTLIEGDDIDLGAARFLIERGKHDNLELQSGAEAASDAEIALVGRSSDELVAAVVAARMAAARAERSRYADITEIIASASRNDTVVGQQLKPRPFGEVAVAYGDREWSPAFDQPDTLETIIGEHPEAGTVLSSLLLPTVPLGVNLLSGSFGIVGERAMVQAAVRAALVSLCVLTALEQLTLVLIANPSFAADWRWANQLPHTTPGRSGTIPLTIVDGIDLETIDPTRTPTGPTMHLARNVHDLPASCTSVLVIDPDGSGRLTSPIDGHDDRPVTPIGVTEDLALEAASALRARTPNPSARG